MGSSTSKAARKLPTQASRAQQPAWAGARTPHVDPAFRQAGQAPEAPPPPKAATRTASPQGLGYSTGKLRMDRGASENMTDDIKRDGQDPDFLANLSRLGQVAVPRPGTPFDRSGPGMQTLLSRSSLTSTPQSTPTAGFLSADQLSTLLDRLKTTPAGQESVVYKRFGLDEKRIKELRRWVNSPSVDKERTKVEVNEQGEETVKMMAVWVDREPSATAGATASR